MQPKILSLCPAPNCRQIATCKLYNWFQIPALLPAGFDSTVRTQYPWGKRAVVGRISVLPLTGPSVSSSVNQGPEYPPCLPRRPRGVLGKSQWKGPLGHPLSSFHVQIGLSIPPRGLYRGWQSPGCAVLCDCAQYHLGVRSANVCTSPQSALVCVPEKRKTDSRC